MCLLILVKHFSFARPDKTQLCSKSVHNPARLCPPHPSPLPPAPSEASRQHFVATELKLVSSPSSTQREWQLTFLFPGDSDLISAAPRPVPAAQRQSPRVCGGDGAARRGLRLRPAPWPGWVLWGEGTWVASITKVGLSSPWRMQVEVSVGATASRMEGKAALG